VSAFSELKLIITRGWCGGLHGKRDESSITGPLDDPLIQLQGETLTILRELLAPYSRVALLDFPSHRNAGDSLIYLGERQYLRKLGIKVSYVCDEARYSARKLRKTHSDGPILLHGGGNLGDRWLVYQDFRERVIKDFPDRQIIQLPQSIEFQDGPRLRQAQRIFECHSNLTIMIRDHVGVATTKKLFPSNRVMFCPDLALGVGLLKGSQSPDVDVLMLLRRDSEAVPAHQAIQPCPSVTSEVVDWGLLGPVAAAYRAAKIPGAIARKAPALRDILYPLLRMGYSAQAWLNVRSAVRMISRGQIVVTDRLHAAVFAALLGMPVVAVDNCYGKLSAIIGDYLGQLPGIKFSRSVEEAEAALVGLLAELPQRQLRSNS
jgi:exopolysaccharide biosynthesis predicted pyruvyltransferase EpsI